MDEERTPGGSRVFRHSEPPDAEIVRGDNPVLEVVSDHVEAELGPIASVFGELVSTTIHLDVLRLDPTADRPATFLVTCGMSALPMAVPEDADAPRFIELVLALPPEWDLESEEERWYWPIRLLKTLGRLPHEYSTWLGTGHTIPNGDPAEEYAPGAGFAGAIVLPPLLTPEGFDRLERPDGEPIEFRGVVPLYADEMELKLRKGTDALIDAWEENGVTVSEAVTIGRPSGAGRRRKRFGLF